MSAPSFYLSPCNGLCNRMRAIMFWAGFADALYRNFTIVWNPGSGFDNTPYQHLFQLPDYWNLIENRDPSTLSEHLVDLNTWFPTETPPSNSKFHPPAPKEFSSVGSYAKRPLHLISSYGSPAPNYAKIVSQKMFLAVLKYCLKPSNAVAKVIKTITDRFSSNTIGLHLRMNDAVSEYNKDSIHYDSLRGTEKWHNAIRTSMAGTTFFLSTDSKAVEEEFLSAYGKRIIVQPAKSFFKTEVWEEKPGQMEALIDLYCLSKTREIIGTSWSSFSQIALLLKQHA